MVVIKCNNLKILFLTSSLILVETIIKAVHSGREFSVCLRNFSPFSIFLWRPKAWVFFLFILFSKKKSKDEFLNGNEKSNKSKDKENLKKKKKKPAKGVFPYSELFWILQSRDTPNRKTNAMQSKVMKTFTKGFLYDQLRYNFRFSWGHFFWF